MKEPAGFEPGPGPVPQPTEAHPENVRAQADPVGYARVAAMRDEVVWERLSETTPPVEVD